MKGRIISHYQVLDTLGQGGMGVVYLAEDIKLRRKVALKFLSEQLADDRQACDRFLVEARAASALNHSHICTLYEIGEIDEGPFIAMELVEGHTLEHLINGKPLKTDTVISLGIQVADALDAAHAKGIIHRDIKATNVMVSNRGEAKVMDFGLAKFSAAQSLTRPDDIDTSLTGARSITATGCLVGTWAYMSPEQIRGEDVDTRTDLFSLGIVLYQAATGQLPFPGDTALTKLDAILNREPCAPVRLNPGLPVELERIIAKALEKDRDFRYQTAAELQADLKRLQRDTAERTLRPGHTAAGARKHRSAVAAHPLTLVAASAVAALIATGIVLQWPQRTTFDSVAVLPFVNGTGNADNDYLSDGITDRLINGLAQVSSLRVVPRSLVYLYRDKNVDPLELGQQLDVAAMVTGRISQRQNRLTLAVELSDAREVAQVWGRQYESSLDDLLNLQDSISTEIVKQLRVGVSEEDDQRLRRRYTENIESYHLYLKGLYYLNKQTPDGIRRSGEFFKRAIDLDPGNALGYSGLADSFSWSGYLALVPAAEAYPHARAAAQRALEIDPDLGEAVAARGGVKLFYDWDFPGAAADLRRALELSPDSARAYSGYGAYLTIVGRHDEALAARRQALNLDPISLETNMGLGWAQYFARQYDAAITQAIKILELDKTYSGAQALLMSALQMNGKSADDFIRILSKYDSDLARAEPLRQYLAVIRGTQEAKLKGGLQFEEAAKRGRAQAIGVAHYYADIGDVDRAIAWLTTAVRERHGQVPFMNVNPRFDGLKNDKRFQELVTQIGLPINDSGR